MRAFRGLPPQYQQQILDEVDERQPLVLEVGVVGEPYRFDDRYDKYDDDDNE